MNLQSHFFGTEIGKIHYELPETLDTNLPMLIFFHGGSPASQHTGFWNILKEDLTKICNPIFTDRFGHGKSILDGNSININDHISLFRQLIESILISYNKESMALVGRSAGGAFGLRLAWEFEKINGLFLIAPAAMKSSIKYFSNIHKDLVLFWDTADPVVKFENYEIIRQSEFNHKLYTIGESKYASKWIDHQGIQKSHVPELKAKEFFLESFADFCNKLSS